MVDPERTANTFYANLFRIDETAKPLFVGNLDMQGRKLVETLGFIIDHLDTPDVILPAAADLARTHVTYGVTKEQYSSVGEALILTFRQLLGPSFSDEDEAAWVDVYGVLATHMTDAAYG